MKTRGLTIATTAQLAPSVEAAGFHAAVLPSLPDEDIHRGIERRLADGEKVRAFLETHPVNLILDIDASRLTLLRCGPDLQGWRPTHRLAGIPHVTLFIDPITATLERIPWEHRWRLLEDPTWIKAVWEASHAQELQRLGIPSVMELPMGWFEDQAALASELPEEQDQDEDPGADVVFMGHPASSWFRSSPPVEPPNLFPGFLAAAVEADLASTPFHKIFFDLYGLERLVDPDDSFEIRAQKSQRFFGAKFAYQAYLALRRRDRFVIFLKKHLPDRFELIGDFWDKDYGLKSKPTLRDPRKYLAKLRRTPICLNLVKGSLETGLNLRHFEVTGAGGFLLTYWTQDLSRYFTIGRECDAFRNEVELLHKIKYYLDHPDERRAIAEAGRRRTLSEHLYSHRIRRLVEQMIAAGVLEVRSEEESREEACLMVGNVRRSLSEGMDS